MIKNRILYILSFSLLLFINSALASTEAEPDTLLKSNTYNLIQGLKDSKSSQKLNPDVVHELVTTHIAPQLDFIAASRWVLGKHWSAIDRTQKISFIKEFRKLLIRFYSVALTEYVSNNDVDHGVIKFLPLPDNSHKNEVGNDITVRSIVTPPNSTKKVTVNYQMHKTRKGWKIYDVSVEGISMIGTYKSSFEPQLRNMGVDDLIASLIDRNNKIAFKKTSLKPQ